jgi:23S rRNA (uracil1939-C5)-methyltransferase
LQRLITVEIEKLSLGGQGIARHEGQVLFVPFSAPGDRLHVRITLQKKNFAEAEIVEILEPAKTRVQAPCPAFGRCGGCNWQHISYEEQLLQKKLIVEEQLSKFLRTRVEIPPVLPSPEPLFYRNRVQLKRFGRDLGYFERSSHKIVDIEQCWIAEAPLNEEIQSIRNTPPPADLQKIQLSLTQSHTVSSSLNQSEPTDDESMGFSQVNRFQNKALIETVLSWCDGGSFSEIYDLYSGSGNFSFPLFQKFPQLPMTAVELNQKSITHAQDFLRKLNLSPKKFRFLLSDVGFFLKRNSIKPGGLVLIDPPRAGCDEFVIRTLSQQPFERMLYLSCNPATLGRDLERLLSFGSGRLRLGRIQAFDMFPQTDHVEVLTEILTSN